MREEQSLEGRIHSVETCGTVDGPGVRFVVFLQGCALRCLYCHNVDTRDPRGGRITTAEAIFEEAKRYRSFMNASGGGVTITGGEPLLQPEFVTRLLKLCREAGIHTALDTSGFCNWERARPALDAADLVLLDIKSIDRDAFRRVTGASRDSTLRVASYLAESRKPVWLRFVLVPGLTDDPIQIQELARYVRGLGNVEKVQVLPFHKLGEYKWSQLDLRYELKDTPRPSAEALKDAIEIFRKEGLNAE